MEATVYPILENLAALLVLILPTIGVTGGIKQLLDGVPDFDFGRIHVDGGLWLSWAVGAVIAIGAIALGYEPITFSGDPAIDFPALWIIVSAGANFTRNLAYR